MIASRSALTKVFCICKRNSYCNRDPDFAPWAQYCESRPSKGIQNFQGTTNIKNNSMNIHNSEICTFLVKKRIIRIFSKRRITFPIY